MHRFFTCLNLLVDVILVDDNERDDDVRQISLSRAR